MARQRLALRPATMDDADLLLGWANEPATRAASLTSRPIERPEHLAWLAVRLADPASKIWIGLEPSTRAPLGVIRFEQDDAGAAVVSISVAAEARGHGVATLLLELGLAAASTALRPSRIVAFVLPDNEASIRLFERAGFRRRSAGRADHLVFERPTRTAGGG